MLLADLEGVFEGVLDGVVVREGLLDEVPERDAVMLGVRVGLTVPDAVILDVLS